MLRYLVHLELLVLDANLRLRNTLNRNDLLFLSQEAGLNRRVGEEEPKGKGD